MNDLRATDPTIADAASGELARQRGGLGMIASENVVDPAVLEALATPFVTRYAEGYPGRRYYSGAEYIDTIESAAIERAKTLFGAEHANVQPHGGTEANLAAYLALADAGDTILAMDLRHGGHLSHGSRISITSKLWKFSHYGVSRDTGLVDMDEVRATAMRDRPKVIVAGYSAYPRHLDFAAFRTIADEVGAYFMVDMAHFAGLVAGHAYPDPVPHADVVTFTTHKTLRGPKGGAILCRRDDRLRPNDARSLATRIDTAMFPGVQGGAHYHAIAAKAVCFKLAAEPAFADYARQTVANARTLARVLMARGVTVLTGGTDNHMVLVDLSNLGIGGRTAEHALERVGIYANKNLIPFDQRPPADPSGIRLGAAWLASRGFKDAEMEVVGTIIATVLQSPTEEVLTDAERQVRELCARFPLYSTLT